MGYRTASLGNPGTPPSYTPARMDRRSVLKAPRTVNSTLDGSVSPAFSGQYP